MAAQEGRRAARARLALRAELAFGVKSVRITAEPKRAPIEGVHHVSRDTPKGISTVASVGSTGSPPVVTSLLGAFTSPALPTDQKRLQLQQLDASEVSVCRKCRLCDTRKNTVFGEGDPDAKILFIGEGPGENEDLQGRPFVGRAGELLDRMIAGMGLKRGQVYIANIVKCRPPGNREPAPDEVAACTPYLERQIELIRPGVIVTLGKPAAHHMIDTTTGITKLRGIWHDWRGIKLMPTFHPAYLLRNYTDQTRRQVWDDLKQVMRELGLPIPSREKN